MDSVSYHAQNIPFSRSNALRRIDLILQKILWTSDKTLTMEPVGSHGKNIPFSKIPMSYKASSPARPKHTIYKVKRTPDSFLPKSFVDVCEDLSYRANNPSQPKHSIFKVKRALGKTLVMEPVGPHGQNVPFSRSNKPQSSWSSQRKPLIFKVKQAPEQVNPPFCLFSCSIVHGLFGDLEFRAHFCQILLQLSIKTLAMDSVSPHGQNIPFSKSNDPRSR
ncbi:hypothetical protein H5410_019309 [Solanum commersonii]|uniref:Uncharacterized protein n=1 Tax=Solanum commersonii TaxID=4109 RepID=A0A9J5Z990_SOLCO|nr:hypothetical protein H5410_019309 [Solanum commersonii]